MSTVNDSPMMLDDVAPVDSAPAKDVDGIPYCRKHHCRMKMVSGGKKSSPTAYYACPVRNCDEKEKRIKTSVPGVVPPNPLACPRCSKGENHIYAERDPASSTAASVILKCPSCGWKSTAFAVPQLAAAHFASRKPALADEQIGER